VRILCLSDEYPWPATSGYRLRLQNILKGLAEAGDVDLFCMVGDRPDLARAPEPPPGIRRLLVHPHPPFGSSVAGLVRWARSGLPRAVAWSDWDGARPALRSWAEAPYDAVWFSHLHTWLALRDPGLGPAVIDLDNLEDEKLRTLMALRQGPRSLHDTIAAGLDRIDIGRWERAQRTAARHARVVVCSELDRDRVGVPTAFVIPNGYDYDSVPSIRRETKPTLTMVGLFVYAPNLDGAQFFARDVLPLVRERVPAATLRLVGRHDGVLAPLRDVPGVEIAGEVDTLDPVFADTTAAVVPLRAGGGTRIKVLEAFARGVPVVTTSLGCEGLAVENGVHCLIADAPTALADACVRLLGEATLAESLAREGRALWEQRYRWQLIHPLVAEAVREVAA
jgi:polysaccharide biosynthesis protein PslH